MWEEWILWAEDLYRAHKTRDRAAHFIRKCPPSISGSRWVLNNFEDDKTVPSTKKCCHRKSWKLTIWQVLANMNICTSALMKTPSFYLKFMVQYLYNPEKQMWWLWKSARNWEPFCRHILKVHEVTQIIAN